MVRPESLYPTAALAPGNDAPAGIILAAGASRRMGRRPKLLLELNGETLLERAIRHAREAELHPLVVVIPKGDSPLAKLVESQSGVVRASPSPSDPPGQLGSLKAGERALPEGATKAVVLLADMPFVTTALIRELVDVHGRQKPVVAVERDGFPAPPLVITRDILLAMLQAPDRRQFLQGFQPYFVDAPQSALLDVDTPADFARAYLHQASD